jgi:hypothetical protein
MEDRQRISEAYLAQQRELHRNPEYGVASTGFAPLVRQLLASGHFASLADYGAGKCRLLESLNELASPPFDYLPYDPAFPEYGPPRPADLVCCIDVLEHIEPEHVDSILQDLADITRKAGFFTIHTGPAVKVLSDGRNAHLIQKPTSWWLPKLCRHFEVTQLQTMEKGFWVLVTPKPAAGPASS